MIIKRAGQFFSRNWSWPFFKYKNRLTWRRKGCLVLKKEKLRTENISFQYPGAATYALKMFHSPYLKENGYLLLDKTVQGSLHLQNY